MTSSAQALLFGAALLFLPSMFVCFDMGCVGVRGWIETNKTCTKYQYLCKDGTACIYDSEVCDGHKDCEAGDDEANCLNLGCSVKNGGCSHQCLPSPGGRSCACPTGMVLSTDDITCTKNGCTAEEFKCTEENKCIPRGLVCDDVNDCEHGSDEICVEEVPNRCPYNDFSCKNGRCILSSWKCDKRDDCGDNSDEDGCFPTTSCSKDEFSCGSGECISKLWRCDGESDCRDNSDETGCHSSTCDTESQIRCGNGQCIPVSWTCDRVKDCVDNADEINCGYLCDTANCSQNCRRSPQGPECFCNKGFKLQKDNKTCLACREDEYFCVYKSRCISKRWICDGDDDCGDGADEKPEICASKVKPPPSKRKLVECEEYSCDISGECIPWSSVCDGVKDCIGLTDEGPLCSSACQDGNGGCSHICQKTPDGPKCACYTGYLLSEDGKTCEDIDECEIPGICSQFCNNTKGGFKCSCADGYFLEHDHKKCKAVNGTATVLYSLPGHIKGFDLRTRDKRDFIEGTTEDIRGMDYDKSEGIIMWSDWKANTINSFVMDVQRNDVLLTTPIRPHYLRWDWNGKNFYYTDDEGNINCCSKNGMYCSTVIQNAAPHINSIDISPNTGFMFWTVWGVVLKRNAGVIERADLDGSHRREIVSDRIMWPTAVTVDHVLEMVYWTDAKLNLMECSDVHGRKRRTVVSEGMYYPFSMTMFEDYVYWADWGTNKFIRCDKFGGRNCIPLQMGDAKTEVMMVIHKAMQPKGVNHCGANRCPQLCIPTPSSYVCKCGSDYLEENSTCVLKSTASPVVTITPSCPDGYCANNAECLVISHNFYRCMCQHPFKGDRCEITVLPSTSPTVSPFNIGWFIVGLTMAVLFILFIFF